MSVDGDRLFCNPSGAYLIGYVQSGLQESASGKECILAQPDPTAAGCLGTWECDILLGKWQLSSSLLDLSDGSESPGQPAFSAFVHPDDRATFLDALQLSRRSPAIREVAHRLPAKNGESRMVSTFILASRIEGKTVKLTGVLFDGDMRKRHTEKTRFDAGVSPLDDPSGVSPRFIEKLAGSLPECIWVSDAEERTFMYRNRDPLRQLGYLPETD